MSGPIERRWREGGGDATDGRIGNLLRRVSDPAPLPEGRLDRVAAALATGAAAPRRRLRPGLRWAVAALVLGSGGAVFARHQIARLWNPPPVVVPPPAPAVPSAEVRRPVARSPVAPAPEIIAAPPEITAPAPIVAPAPAPPSAAPAPVAHPQPRSEAPEPAPVRVASREARATIARASVEDLAPVPPPPPPHPVAAVTAPAPAPAAPGLGEEARLLRRALEELRHERDAREALATLDDHRARFPRGLLRADADLLRVEALLALDRDGEALAVLEDLDLGTSPRAGELRVTRGELRAARDCPAALADFARVLAQAPSPALAERALRGRAVCLLRTSDERAPEALREYLDRFPQGAFADEARRRLRSR